MLLISTVCWLINKNRENEIIKHYSSRSHCRVLPLFDATSLHRDIEQIAFARVVNVQTGERK